MVQPVLGPYGESPETFVAVDASPSDIVTFALLVAVVPIVVVVAVAAASRPLGARIRGIVQSLLVAALAGLAATALVRHLGAGTGTRLLAAAAAAAAVAFAHRRWAPARSFLRFASPTPLLLVAAFLLASPVAPLVRPASTTVGDGTGTADDLPPVLMIVLDELPTSSLMDGRGGVDRDLLPNLARLADTSTWYRNHTIGASRTAVSLPTIVTGRFPAPGPQRPAVHGEYPDNLFTLLGATHDVHAVEWVTDLCPPSLCDRATPPIDDDAAALLDRPVTDRAAALPRLAGEALDLWWGQVWPTAVPPDADYAVAGAVDPDELARPGIEFVSGLIDTTGDRPTFDYLHAPVPHQPWGLLPSGATYEGPHPADGSLFGGWGDDDLAADLGRMARVRHLLQLQWADRMLGTIIDRMEDLDRWDDAVVVLTADHGISFERGQAVRVLDPGNASDIAWAPLFVKAPGQTRAEVVDDNVLAVDVVPTIADLVGVELGWEADGISLQGPPRSGSAKPVGSAEPDRFGRPDDEALVDVGSDGLGEVLAAGTPAGDPDPLRVWRHGRHGDLLGMPVEDVGVCPGVGPPLTYSPPRGWTAHLDGTLDRASDPVPLWHEGTVAGEEPVDVAAAVDGVVVAWSPAYGATEELQFGFLLAEPLVDGATTEDPVFYQVVDGAGCGLVPLAT